MLALTLKVSELVTLAAEDEDEDTIVQDMTGHDYMIVFKNGIKYWELYTDINEDCEELQHYCKLSNLSKLSKPSKPSKLPAAPFKKADVSDDNEEVNEVKVPRPRQPTAYNMFLKEVLKELSKTHTHLNNKDRMKLASQRWNELKNHM